MRQPITRNHKNGRPSNGPAKCQTGIQGLDEITLGGLPRGRTTLVCGGPGCGKTLLGMEFLMRGAAQFGEPGVCISFEESAEELRTNVASVGFDLSALVSQKKLSIDHVDLERSLIEEAGEYDLEALFVRMGHAVESVGARRVLFDGVEALFAGLKNESLLRSELRRLFRWLKDHNLTAIVTAERGNGELTRHGLEEYISDCVILLDHRVNDSVLTRRLRVVKYRGSTHGTNEYPFLIEEDGISVLPVTSIGLKHAASDERVSTGVPALDAMFGGKGYFRGSSILVSGTAGTGKTSLSAHFVNASCSRGERCIFFSFEESGNQIIRNMRSIGIDLRKWVDKGLLHIDSARPTTFGLEMHLVKMHKTIREFKPSLVVVDPASALLHSGPQNETHGMLLRLIDYLKGNQITALMTTLSTGQDFLERTAVDISSLVDTWLLVRDIESGSERNRGLYILKARGLAHSNQIREFVLTDHGVELRDVYLGEAGLLTGSARLAQESRDEAAAMRARGELHRKQASLDQKRRALQAQIAALQAELQNEESANQEFQAQEDLKLKKRQYDREKMTRSRNLNIIVAPPARATAPKTRGAGK